MEAIIIAIIGVVGTILAAVLTEVVRRWLGRRRLVDRDLFVAWRSAFDRGAFRGTWQWGHSDLVFFEEAIRHTSHAVATGQIDTANPDEQGRGKATLRNPVWRDKMEEVAKGLDKILIYTRDFRKGEEEEAEHATEFYGTLWPRSKRSGQAYEKALQNFQQAEEERKQSLRELANTIDQERDEIIKTLNEIWSVLKIPKMVLPTEIQYRSYYFPERGEDAPP